MTKTINIRSAGQFAEVLKASKVVVADFYADWCASCKAVAPIYEQLSTSISRENLITFVKINNDSQTDIFQAYRITAMPTFVLFQDGKEINRVVGPDHQKLQEMLKKLGDAANSSGSGASGSGGGLTGWKGAAVPRGYNDITNQVELRGCSLLNADDDVAGPVRVLFDDSQPSALDNANSTKKDWVVSGADDQLLLFMPFQSVIKAHTIQITSLPPKDDDDAPMRPEEIKLFTNKPRNMDFDEADNEQETQSVTLSPEDWNEQGTATISLRFVKFQKCTSLIIYVVKGAGEGEIVRLDRIRVIGECGEKREMGKLEKMGDLPGE